MTTAMPPSRFPRHLVSILRTILARVCKGIRCEFLRDPLPLASAEIQANNHFNRSIAGKFNFA